MSSQTQTPLRPLRREGAVILLSAAEQAMEDAMLRSSSPLPEPVLGKRTHQEGDSASTDGDDAPPNDMEPTTHQQVLPSIGSIAAATTRYAARKKLRPDQRDELDAFLSVSSIQYPFVLLS